MATRKQARETQAVAPNTATSSAVNNQPVAPPLTMYREGSQLNVAAADVSAHGRMGWTLQPQPPRGRSAERQASDTPVEAAAAAEAAAEPAPKARRARRAASE